MVIEVEKEWRNGGKEGWTEGERKAAAMLRDTGIKRGREQKGAKVFRRADGA